MALYSFRLALSHFCFYVWRIKKLEEKNNKKMIEVFLFHILSQKLQEFHFCRKFFIILQSSAYTLVSKHEPIRKRRSRSIFVLFIEQIGKSYLHRFDEALAFLESIPTSWVIVIKIIALEKVMIRIKNLLKCCFKFTIRERRV